MTRKDILIVEDDPADAQLVARAFSRTELGNRVHVARDGEEGLDFLAKRGAYGVAPTPHLVLLDLNMPGISGLDFLEKVGAKESLINIPIVVLTTSGAQTDIHRAYELGAAAYTVKPDTLKDYELLVKRTEDFWFRRVLNSVE